MTVGIEERLQKALAALQAIEKAAERDFGRIGDGAQPVSAEETLNRVRKALAAARQDGLL
ncbi:hypothetical protein [Stenotrophomonas sp.]|uniref:hypothetical protein n=1 Tax=Stenotrophomonas sp. TaxID=69392 RepID=UPI00289A5AC1|nr:hypothetical protein [Stenotrophomonas sp.]